MAYKDTIWGSALEQPKVQPTLPVPQVSTTKKSAYQQNVSQPVAETQGRTTRDVLAKISDLYKTNPEKADLYLTRLQSAQQNPSSKYYNPFTMPTNKAVSNLTAYGFDVGNLNDDWFNQNKGWISSNLLYNGTTNTPSKPGKKATTDQKVAYELYQYQKSEEDTKKVEQQWAALQEELTYWTQRKDKNYSDEQVLEKIDWSKYGMLVKMDDSRKNYQPIELNRAVDYSEDALYGVIWNARNPEYKGSLLGAMAYSASGAGNVWKEDPEITARLDTTNMDTYAPYTVGSTMDDVCLYYGKDSFDADWVTANRPDGRDATETKMWNRVEEAERFTTEAESQLADFNSWLDRKLQSADDPAEVMRAVDSRLATSKYQNLRKMNDSLRKVDSLVDTTRAIDFSYNDIKRKVEDACAKNAGKLDGQQTLENNGADIAPEQTRQTTKVSDKNVKDASLMLDGATTAFEQLVLDNTPSILYGTVKQILSAINPVALISRNEPTVTTSYTTNMIGLSADIALNQSAQAELNRIEAANDKYLSRLQELRSKWESGEEDKELKVIKDLWTGDWQWNYNSFDDAMKELYLEVTGSELADNEDAIANVGVFYDYIVGTKDINDTWVLPQLSEEKQKLEADIERTHTAQADYDKQQQAWDARIALYDQLGLDSTGLRTAKIVANKMLKFSEYEATKWSAYSTYDQMEQGMESGATLEQVMEAAQKGDAQNQKMLDDARWLKKYVTENNVEIPADYMKNLDRYIAKLERAETDYNYFALRGESDFDELAVKGKEIEDQLNIPLDAKLDNISDYMTDTEKETYYYLMAKYGSEDPMKGREEAMRYWGYLSDPQYGVIPTRINDAYKQFAKSMVASKPITANILAGLAAPMEGLMGVINFGVNAVMGWESNPDSQLLALGNFSQTVNEETANRIKAEVPKGPGQDLALGAYEILYNRFRSTANTVLTGGLSIGGRLGAVLTELVGAAPMAVGAAAMAVADAKRKGADDGTAYKIGAVTFLMEDFTEGLTRSNIMEAVNGGGGALLDSVKARVADWLTSSGLEEAFGETLTDYVENEVNKNLMGALGASDHQALIDKWIEELKLDPNNPVDVQRADALATQDEIAGLVHTAIISYLSPGTDIVTGTISEKINDFHNIRAVANGLRQSGVDVELSEAREAYENWKAGGPQTKLVSEETPGLDFAASLGQLDAVTNSDETTQAAALSDVFSREENTAAGDVANAAAASITNVFGTMGSAIRQVKNIMTAARVAQREELVRQALQTGALSPASAAAQALVSDEFANASSLNEQVSMLADTVEQDANNEAVQREIGNAVREYRIAAAEKEIIAGGALESISALQEAADKARATIEDAQNDYDARTNEVIAKGDMVNEALEALSADPTADNQHALDRALNELEKADAVKQEYEQRLENATTANEDAQAKFEEARDAAMQDVRKQAEQVVAEQDQQRAEAEKQALIQQELDRMAQAEQQTEANYARAQADEIIEENFANATEEEKEKIRGIVSDLRQQKQSATDRVLEHQEYVNRIAKKFGYNINIGDTTQGGRFLYQNASVNPKTGEITLSEQASVDDAMYAILVHELTHIAEGSEDLYNEMADALIALKYGDDTNTLQADIDSIQKRYRDGLTLLQQQGKNVNPDDVTPEYARQELVADLMGELLSGDDELLNRLAQESPTVARRIVEAIKSFLKKMVGIQEAPLTDAQKIVDKLEAALRDVEAKKANAEPAVAVPMVKNSLGQPLVSELPGGTSVLDAPMKFSLNSFDEKEQERVRQALYNKTNARGKKQYTKAQVDQYLDDAMGIAAVIAADKTRLDFEASDNQVFLKPNNDYYFTLDASTLCAKRLLYQGTFDYVQHELPDEVFTPEDLIDLVNIMSDMGYETPCGICYVESRRRWLDTYAQKFLDTLPEEGRPSIDDLTTSDGLEQLRHSDPEMYQKFVAAMNKKGTQNPKVVQLRTEYRGDIGELTAKDIQKVKDIGGLRIQSFSDFETPHLLDMVQAVLDMSAVGLTSQAYTKVSNFAWVFGDTGIKINLSLIGKGTGLDENGNLVFDNREGINFDEAMKLRERYSKNVGTILVGINDEHIIAAMGDPRVDFIIPFHKSGWSDKELKGIRSLQNYHDYTDTQNERLIIGRKKDGSYETESFQKHKERTKESFENFQPVGKNGYWNFKKSGQWNAEQYLKMCAKANRVPKFSQFLVDNGNGSFSLPQGTDKRSTSIREGYWKTLIDFKMYENDSYGRTREDGTMTEVKGAAQQEVTPNINMAEAYRVLNDYKLGRQMPDQADGTPGRFIPMENNNSVPVATPAGDRYIKLIRQKRAGIKPTGPNPDKLEADLPVVNPRANAFGASSAPAVLGNEESTAQEPAAAQQASMAIDAETGETVRRFSLPSQEDIDRAFEEYIEGLTAEELEKFAQEEYGVSLSSPANPIETAKETYREAVESGDKDTAHDIIGKLAKAAGYTVYGTHRTNAKFNTFEKSARSGARGKSLGDGFYVAKGEGTEYDNDHYGKNRMLVYVNPGKPLDLAEGGLPEDQAKQVYDKYFAPYHPNAVGDDNPYTAHVIAQLQNPYKVIDYIKEAAENVGTTTDEVLKDLGYNSVKDGPQYAVFDSSQIKLADPITYDDEGNPIPMDQRFNRGNDDIRYSLPADAPYLSAVNHGDMDAAAEDLKRYAEERGYTDEAYHGTKSFGFTEFDMGTSQNEIFVAYSPEVSRTYTDEASVREIGKNPTVNPATLTNEELAKRLNAIDGLKHLGYYVISIEPMSQEDMQAIVGHTLDNALSLLNGKEFSDLGDRFGEGVDVKGRFVEEAAKKTLVSEDEWEACDTPKEMAELFVERCIYGGDSLTEFYNLLDNLVVYYAEPDSKTYKDLSDLIRNAQLAFGPEGENGVFREQSMTSNGTTDWYMSRGDVVNYYDRIIGNGIYRLYTRPGNQLVIDAHGTNWNRIPASALFDATDGDAYDWDNVSFGDYLKTREIADIAKRRGYNSVRINNVYDHGGQSGNKESAFGDIGIFFKQDDVKSADTVVYDDDGNIIPPSERFTSSPDIRYSLPSDRVLTDQIRYYMENGPQETITPNTGTTEAPRQRQWGRKGAQASDELAEIVKRHVFKNNTYTPTTNAKELDRAIEWIRSNRSEGDEDGYYTSVQKIKDNRYNYRTADGQARVVATIAMAVAKNDTGTQAELSDIYNRQGTSIAQALQARKLWLLMTPEGREQSMKNMLTRTQNDLNAKGTDVTLKLSDWVYMAARAAEEEGDLQKAYQAAARELAEQLPQNWRDKFRSWRMLSMLGNPRTHIRNVLGNAFFVPVVGLKNKLGAIAELGTTEKTKTLAPFLTKAVRDFARQDAIAMKDELTGEAKYNEDNMVQREQKAFKGLLQAVIDFNSDALEKEDWIFLKGHYRRALGGWMMANGYTAEQMNSNPALLNAGRDYAINEAHKATYRDFNKLASNLNKLSRDGGVTGFLVDATLPFKKTPANILRRGMEYSPVGLMRSLTSDIYRLKQWKDAQNGKLNELPEKALSPTQFIDRICSGLAGSAVLAEGFLLGGMGVVSCGLDDDDDKLEEVKGGQKYAINFGKLVNKIFNAKILSEDVTFTMDWAAPMSMPFFVGAAIQQQLAKEGDFDAEEVLNAIGNISEPVLNLSMLDGVNTLFKTSQYDDTNTLTQIGAKIVSNYATSYVPSLLGAIARTVDDKRRKAYVKSGEGTGVLGTLRYALEQTENKIPGLSQTNIPYRDVWGNPETSGLAERIIENFIAPGYISSYKNDPVLNEMERLYQTTGDAAMIPEDPKKTATYKNQKYVFTAEEWDAYKAARGQTAYSALTELINTPDYQNAEAGTQVQMIKDAWSYANKVGLAAVIPDYELKEASTASLARDSKITSYKAEMIKALNAEDYVAYETMVEALREEEVEDSDIKAKIRDTYRDQYKAAYRNNNKTRMAEIEDLLDNTGFDFTDLIAGWEDQVDENR